MTDIIELDDRTVSQIAAGEVVDRPASVVKELVENSLDADASRIDITVKEGGTELIRIADDGHGMTRHEAQLAVQEHTTSKIRDITDLEERLGTLGFRGEALHAIGAVSTLTITTRAADSPRATELTVDHGDVGDATPAGRAVGTTIEVTDLFAATPARRKFLKSTTTEFDHINRMATRYALANPDVAISLTHNENEVFATTGQGDLQAALLAVYGREVAEAMLELPDHDMVAGYVSHPETTRSTRDYLSTYINGRYVQSNVLRRAIVDAYGNQLAADRYPFAVLFLELDPAAVDVNVHPRKMEVRYSEPEEVKRQVRTVIEDALRNEGILRSSAPRGRSAPDQAKIEPSPTSNDNDEPTTDSTADVGTTDPDEPSTDEVDNRPSQFTDASRSTSSSPSSPQGSTSEDTKTQVASSRSTSQSTSTSDSTVSPSSQTRPSQTTSTDEPKRQTTLSGDDAHPSTEYDNFPDLRVLGQLHDTYIMAETEDGLILIDQHAADERINYERLKEQFEGDTTTQALADPVELELTAREASLFDGYQDALARLGFYANQVDDRTVEITTVPGLIAESAGPTVIRDILDDLVSGENVAENTVEAVADELLSDMACHPSITGNTSLTDGSVVNLLSALDDCENPWACPHGRPVLIHIDSDEIDGRFERDYPGH